MLAKLFNKDEGFTLIEITIVLAIAALILVIVFLAVSGAQRARRDTQRNSDIGRFRAAVEQFAANNSGAIPTSQANLTTIQTSYLTANGATWSDPLGGAYVPTYQTLAPTNTTDGKFSYKDGNICSGAAMTTTGASARNYAVLYLAEQGGTICVDNR